MTTKEAITHRALRCRPAKRDTYVTTHEALLAEAEYLQQTDACRSDVQKTWMLVFLAIASWSLSIVVGFIAVQIIKGWFA